MHDSEDEDMSSKEQKDAHSGETEKEKEKEDCNAEKISSDTLNRALKEIMKEDSNDTNGGYDRIKMISREFCAMAFRS